MSLLDDLLTSWSIHLRALNRSKETIRGYHYAVRHFDRWCQANERPRDPVKQTALDVREWVISQLGRGVDNSASTRFGQLQQWFRWLAAEGEIPASPMTGVQRPKPIETPPPVLDDEQLSAIVAACAGNDWRDRRDMAMMRLFIDTGMRLAELTRMNLSELDLASSTSLITGKGNRRRLVPFGTKTTQALDRYLRARARRPHASSDSLWLSNRGPISRETVGRIVDARGRRAGIDDLHAHLFRHTAAHNWLVLGGQEQDLMTIAGWRSRDMIARYGRSAAAERARQAHRRLAPGDRI